MALLETELDRAAFDFAGDDAHLVADQLPHIAGRCSDRARQREQNPQNSYRPNQRPASPSRRTPRRRRGTRSATVVTGHHRRPNGGIERPALGVTQIDAIGDGLGTHKTSSLARQPHRSEPTRC